MLLLLVSFLVGPLKQQQILPFFHQLCLLCELLLWRLELVVKLLNMNHL
jgi:hypothetical protein